MHGRRHVVFGNDDGALLAAFLLAGPPRKPLLQPLHGRDQRETSGQRVPRIIPGLGEEIRLSGCDGRLGLWSS